MRWEDIEKQFDIDIPDDEPLFPMNVVCELLHMQYYLLREIIKEGIVKKKTKKKLFSRNEMKRLRYIKYLIDEKGINVKGVKFILEMSDK